MFGRMGWEAAAENWDTTLWTIIWVSVQEGAWKGMRISMFMEIAPMASTYHGTGIYLATNAIISGDLDTRGGPAARDGVATWQNIRSAPNLKRRFRNPASGPWGWAALVKCSPTMITK